MCEFLLLVHRVRDVLGLGAPRTGSQISAQSWGAMKQRGRGRAGGCTLFHLIFFHGGEKKPFSLFS